MNNFFPYESTNYTLDVVQNPNAEQANQAPMVYAVTHKESKIVELYSCQVAQALLFIMQSDEAIAQVRAYGVKGVDTAAFGKRR